MRRKYARFLDFFEVGAEMVSKNKHPFPTFRKVSPYVGDLLFSGNREMA